MPYPNFISVRCHMPSDFETGSFRYVTIKKERGIFAVVGKIKGQNKTTVQAFRFAKDKGWTKETALAWVKKHGYPVISVDEAEYEFKELDDTPSYYEEKFINCDIEIINEKAITDDGKLWFSGKAYVNKKNGEMYFDLDDETITTEALTNAIKGYSENPVIRFMHGRIQAYPGQIGKAEEIKMIEDGLHIKAWVSSSFPEIQKLMKEGLYRRMSIGFAILKFERWCPNDETCKIIFQKIVLLECSICDIPANPEAKIDTIGNNLDSPTKEQIDYVVKSNIDNLEEKKIEVEITIDGTIASTELLQSVLNNVTQSVNDDEKKEEIINTDKINILDSDVMTDNTDNKTDSKVDTKDETIKALQDKLAALEKQANDLKIQKEMEDEVNARVEKKLSEMGSTPKASGVQIYDSKNVNADVFGIRRTFKEKEGKIYGTVNAKQYSEADIQAYDFLRKHCQAKGWSCAPLHPEDRKLIDKINEKAVLGGAAAATGGSLLPEEWASEIIGIVYEKSFMRQLCPSVTMTADTLNMPSITGSARVYRWRYTEVETATDVTSTINTTSEVELSMATIIANVPIGNRVVSYGVEGVLPSIKDDIISLFVKSEQDMFINGDTETTYNANINGTYNGSTNVTGINASYNNFLMEFDGLRKLNLDAQTAGEITNVNASGATITSAHVRKAVASLGVYGDEPSDLVMLCSRSTAATIRGWDEVETIDVYGPEAPIVTGTLGRLQGMRVIATSRIRENLDSHGVYVASNSKTIAIIFAAKYQLIGVPADRNRQFSITVWDEPKQDLFNLIPRMDLAFGSKHRDSIIQIYNLSSAVA